MPLHSMCDADRTEQAFELLRYFLGGDRPSQTARLTLFLRRFHGARLEFRYSQGGISLAAGTELAPGFKPPTYATQTMSKPNVKVQ